MQRGLAWSSFGRAAALLLTALVLALPLQSARADVENGMVMGVDIPGNDIQRFQPRGPDPGLCRLACDQNQQCRAWTYVKPGAQGPTAVCYLKSGAPQTVANPIAISGPRTNGGPAPGGARVDHTMLYGIDYPGEDLQSFALQRADPGLCQNACENHAQCRAWTFIKPGVQGPPICWLKRGVPQGQASVNLISGLRRSPLPPGPPIVGPGPGGGPGGGGGTGPWGVWASAAGGKWNDPCAINYNAAVLDKNRYDGNPGYRRVRVRATQQEADLDINHFGRFHQNNPDGVVKMVKCDPNAGGGGVAGGGNQGGGQGQGGGPGGGGNYRAWMTGNFDSSFGKMNLSPGGGAYAYHNGTMRVTKIEGAVMEGIWTEPTGTPCASGGGHSGRFRFTFTATGFTGVWGHCNLDLTEGRWSGTRVP